MEETTTPGGATGAANESEETSSRFGRARDFMNDTYSTASDKVRDGYQAVREKVDDVDMGAVTDQVRSYVRSNPGKALLISIGAGFLIGLLLRRDDDEFED